MKIPPMTYIKVPPMDVKPFDPTKNTIKFEMAAVIDKARDEAVIAAIRAYAIEKGYEGVFVIDEDFIKSAIAHEYYIRARTMADLICNDDVVEVRHGEWVVDAYNGDEIVRIPYKTHQHDEPYCSLCGTYALLDGKEDYMPSNFCPNCGAKMDGKRLFDIKESEELLRK